MEPSCRVCNNYVLPLFPFTTILNFDQEDKSFANIYETVTQKKVCDKSSTLNEVCLVCSQSIIRAYITINKIKSQSQKNAAVSSINEDFTSTTNYGRSNTSVNRDKNCKKSTSELKSTNNSTKNVVHTKPKSPKLKNAINGDNSKTLVRCRFCKKILYGHQIAAHAKICTKPDALKIVLNDSAKSAIGSQNALNENKDMHRNTGKNNTVKNQSLNSEKLNAAVNNGKVTKSIDCLLLCRLCNQKLYMSQMNEHKKNCSKKSIIEN